MTLAGEAEPHAFLRQLFSCSDEVADRILARTSLRHYDERAVIVRQGDRPALIFLMMLGRTEAYLCTAEGQLVLLCDYGPGDLFGDLGDDEDPAGEAEIVAVEDVRLFLFGAADFVRLAEAHGCIGLALTRMLLRRLRSAARTIYERSALSATGRVCAEVLRQARAGEGLTIRPAPRVSRLAEQASTTRETASRVMNGLERRGIIARTADTLTLIAPARLEEMIV
jgi:CRP/FNR family transcriptional regulator, cyclic AMP receptor protein